MDESGFDHESIHPYGSAPIGKPCIDGYNWQGKKRTNVIGALYEKMLFALYYFDKNINDEIFYDWCKHTQFPSLRTKCVIVIDNARFHKSKRIQELLNRHGDRILWLQPYSPNLKPIDKKWARLRFLRQGWMQNYLSKLFYDIFPDYNNFILN
ncbi:transposase [Psychrobacter cibarius]|uniref:transposase n=1 Tax=Psychrobacter cibarius TaxID=282669 RepID=UPI001D0FC307|nr:transposase [Psychrobacter cibarius]